MQPAALAAQQQSATPSQKVRVWPDGIQSTSQQQLPGHQEYQPKNHGDGRAKGHSDAKIFYDVDVVHIQSRKRQHKVAGDVGHKPNVKVLVCG
eukprot:CAMPEP_0173074746 /NCGR_PEP_ID=MMETSP1102-20130122/11196_1 /TAXON_ID=49646 /ORGANISM="Geminigera sp., Strain Caron Lab Isolate" /LENGTH=92 /DNA_ID=CAMNT_0013943865 /DNA_START=21 /DNA_END=300 /DNA_ORIENTATION=+